MMFHRFAAGYGHVNVLKWLVQRGCDIDHVPKGGAGPAVLRAARFGNGMYYSYWSLFFASFCVSLNYFATVVISLCSSKLSKNCLSFLM
jgi:ankyrin repeat protein